MSKVVILLVIYT